MTGVLPRASSLRWQLRSWSGMVASGRPASGTRHDRSPRVFPLELSSQWDRREAAFIAFKIPLAMLIVCTRLEAGAPHTANTTGEARPITLGLWGWAVAMGYGALIELERNTPDEGVVKRPSQNEFLSDVFLSGSARPMVAYV